MVDISLSGMKSRVQRGRARIRDMFEACCRVSVDARGKVIGCESRPDNDLPEDLRDAARLWAERHGRCGETSC